MRFKITDIDNERYYQMPKSLFAYRAYSDLSLQAKVIYCILKDRMSLSRKNHWIDQNGDIFLMFQQQEIADILHVNKSTVCRDMKSLSSYGLIELSDQGRGRCHRIYINKIDVPESADEILNIEEHLGEAAKQAEEEEAQYQAMINPEFYRDEICNSAVAHTQSSGANMQSRVARTQPSVAQEQPQVAPVQPQIAHTQPQVAPVQPNDTNLENLTSKTEYSDPEREKEEEEEDTRARVQPGSSFSGQCKRETHTVSQDDDVYEYCLANLHPQTPLVPIERELLAELCREYGLEWVRAAIHSAVLYGHPSLQYVRATLANWQKYGFQVRPEPQGRACPKSSSKKNSTSHKPPTSQQIVDNVKAMWMGAEL